MAGVSCTCTPSPPQSAPRRLTAQWTLSYAEYEVLVALTDHPESSLPPFEIAGRRGWEQSRVSHQVDQTVKRAAVQATKAGRQAITSAAPGHVAGVRELFVVD